ncbi:cysteine hydrolase [Nocardia otitidiscaviarum]|uniref:Cysteine hydrolase n=1 Tax=Nocardia otitidiscaviarum TaxID=1823 RepID=A0A516NPF1_9NOCA|nr:isochorismatase family protein [Nocardia otitidiscaviarum]MCP9623970.1 cysteine hydrolase [Nocardia otitidiscaviarum]QDP80755.1 cysteine hydrolase [Nocardia otitidiscaviarum]
MADRAVLMISFFTYTELDPVLRNFGAQRLLVAGLQTNVCVEATVRAALERNYEVAVAENAVSTDRPALHRGALDSMRVLYAPFPEIASSIRTRLHLLYWVANSATVEQLDSRRSPPGTR